MNDDEEYMAFRDLQDLVTPHLPPELLMEFFIKLDAYDTASKRKMLKRKDLVFKPWEEERENLAKSSQDPTK